MTPRPPTPARHWTVRAASRLLTDALYCIIGLWLILVDHPSWAADWIFDDDLTKAQQRCFTLLLATVELLVVRFALRAMQVVP